MDELSRLLTSNTVKINSLLADSFSKYRIKVIPNKVCKMRLYTMKYCIFQVNRLILSRNFAS